MSLALVSAIALSFVAAPSRAQSPHELPPTVVAAPTVFVGRVLAANGRPVRGAVVETSAGGACTSAADGSFELAVELPPEIDSVEVTATVAGATRDLVASATIVPPSLSSIASLGELVVLPATRPPRWLPSAGPRPGMDGSVEVFAVCDDGRGPTLFMGGNFTIAGGASANCIARWDGERWNALGNGLSNIVSAIVAFDDGTGPALYAAGNILNIGLNYVARWDGAHWSPLGSGMDNQVVALAVFDDGSGPALYAGGLFTQAGGVATNGIARWDGTSWSAVGGGIDGPSPLVSAFAVFDDGRGPALYAAGRMTSAGGVTARRIARWDGTSWSGLGIGVNGQIQGLAVFDDGRGPALYAAGAVQSAGGVLANEIARWDGAEWSALGDGLGGWSTSVSALAVCDDGGRPALFAAGSFTSAGGAPAHGLARWDGTSWDVHAGDGLVGNVPGGLSVRVDALLPFDDGHRTRLLASGSFRSAGGLACGGVAAWDGGQWSLLERGPNDEVAALAVFDDGAGRALYAGGSFEVAGGASANGIARWDGASWSPLASGVSGRVEALAACDAGGTRSLYAGGAFLFVGDEVADFVARWDGSSWSTLAGGLDSEVMALASFDDGGGPALYAGGAFTHAMASGAAVQRIARWDGTLWSALGTGMDGGVEALAVFDDGGGPALYAGGWFTSADGVAANRIARWDGTSWCALASGTNDVVLALAVWDDGHGPALYAGGRFTSAGGVAAKHVARWDGASWTALGIGEHDDVFALAAFDDGRGPALFALGQFARMDGDVGWLLARWDGATWSRRGIGLGTVPGRPERGALAAFGGDGPGDPPSLFASGAFVTSPSGDSFLARWGARPRTRSR